MLTRQQVKFEWTSVHQTPFLHLKEAIIQAPILHYQDPDKNTLCTQMPPMMHVEHISHRNTMEPKFPIAFLSHTFTETQRKWSTTKQEAYGVYYTITKWNYYLQGANITVKNDHKPLAWFLNGKNANNKVNR